MGNIIRIKEGGLPKAFDAAKLRTNLQGGGNCLWIPKESVPVASKFITENGTYLAAAEGLHGFSSLNVSSQPDYVVGNKGGKTYHVHKGGPTGNELIYDELPTEIRVVKAPTRIRYKNGDRIDYKGIVVKAYLSNGDVWENEKYPGGVIPYEELIFPAYVLDKKSDGFAISLSEFRTYNESYLRNRYNYESEEQLQNDLDYLDGVRLYTQNILSAEYRNISYVGGRADPEGGMINVGREVFLENTWYAHDYPMITVYSIAKNDTTQAEIALLGVISISEDITSQYRIQYKEYGTKGNFITQVKNNGYKIPDDFRFLKEVEDVHDDVELYLDDVYAGNQAKKAFTYDDKTVEYQRNYYGGEKIVRSVRRDPSAAPDFPYYGREVYKESISHNSENQTPIDVSAISYSVILPSQHWFSFRDEAAWALKYGAFNPIVEWTRYGDGKILKTDFAVSVND